MSEGHTAAFAARENWPTAALADRATEPALPLPIALPVAADSPLTAGRFAARGCRASGSLSELGEASTCGAAWSSVVGGHRDRITWIGGLVPAQTTHKLTRWGG
jgi:hypothetical protein